MMSKSMRSLLRTSVVLVGGVAACPVVAENLSTATRLETVHETVQQAMLFDVSGDSTRRDILLSQALREQPDFQLARWRSGFVRIGGDWISVASRPARAQAVYRTYATRRNKSLDGARDELELAHWCGRNHLKEIADVHYRRVADNAENEMSLRYAAAKKLGLRRVWGKWVSQEDLDEYRRMVRQANRDLEHWSNRISRWTRALNRQGTPQAANALEDLRGIRDTSAIPALELVLSTASEKLASESVLIIAGIEAKESTESLARHSVASDWPSVRDEAIVQLQKRPVHESIPVLLSALQTPIHSVFQVSAGADGRVLHQHVFAHEREDGIYELTIQELATPMVQLRNTVIGISNANQQSQLAQRRAEALQQRVAQFNEAAPQFNERVYEVLRRISGQTLRNDPVAWWDWWKDYNEIERPTVKPTLRLVHAQRSVYRPTAPPRASECFPAGTKVWTDRGKVPIESIQIGDRVLSQDVETAELTYKVVQAITRRSNAPMQKLIFDSEPLVLTTGHPVWINGTGWRMAKRVRLGDRAHALWGSRKVTSMELLPPDEVFNLIVADFGTYFVGDAGILVHDNTDRAPTRATTPGLLAQN